MLAQSEVVGKLKQTHITGPGPGDPELGKRRGLKKQLG